MKIVVHIAIEITEDGQVRVQRSSWTPADRPTKGGPIHSTEVAAFAAAFVRIAGQHPDAVPDGQPLFPDDVELELGADGRSAASRGQYLTTTPPSGALDTPTIPRDPLSDGIAALMSVGVTGVVARQLVQVHGTARATSVAKWMRGQAEVANADALAKKVLARPLTR